MPRAYLVYNPAAGRFPSWLLAERAANVFRRRGWNVRLLRTRDGAHLTKLARRAANKGMDALFVVGGDGSVSLAAGGLVGSETALGVLPAGTSNVWAQELGLPGLSWTRWMALEESARLLLEGETRSVDLGVCNGRPFLMWAGVGLDAFVVHRLEPRSRWEKHVSTFHFAAMTIWNASFWHGMNLKAVADREQVSGHFLVAIVCNIHLYAGGLARLSPEARLDDGVMDLWLFKGETLGDAVLRWADLVAGRHVQSEQVIHLPFRSLFLESDSPLYVQVDGEPAKGNGSANVDVRPQALRVLVPRQTPHTLFGQPALDRLVEPST